MEEGSGMKRTSPTWHAKVTDDNFPLMAPIMKQAFNLARLQ